MALFGRKKDNYSGSSMNNTSSIGTTTSGGTTPKIRLTKASEALDGSIIRLTKRTGVDLSTHKARVFVVMDRSGSMYFNFHNGKVQDVLTRLLPLALKFDDNGELEVYVFNTKCKQMPAMNLQNYENYVKQQILQKGYEPQGGTCYAPVINQTVADYNDGDPNPAFGIVITDGENSDERETDRAVRGSSNYRNFYQFVGIGNERFRYLQKLDDLTGRAVDNTAFIKVEDFAKLTDDELYDLLLEQYPQWLKAMGIN